MTNDVIRSEFCKTVLQSQNLCKDTIIVNELGLKNGESRADIAVLNGKMIGYEIKTERDSLSRLHNQSEIYSSVFDLAFLIVAEKHLRKALDIIPVWWGVYLITKGNDDAISFKVYRKAKRNSDQDTFSMVQLLWKDEALDLANAIFNLNIKSKVPKDIIYEKLSTSCRAKKMSEIVISYLKKRHSWRKDPLPLS